MTFAVWYVQFRLKSLLGLNRAWPLALLPAAVLGGYMLIFYAHGPILPRHVPREVWLPMPSGRHPIDGLTLLVSQGAGTFGSWMRLGSRNEVQVVNLVPAA
ncbi:hypothetical protein EV687_0368 [Corticibacter populi]|nr:hypothetical protein EV687_0368 [Corticibacter populi]